MFNTFYKMLRFKIQTARMNQHLKYAISLKMSHSQQYVYFTNHARRVINL